MIGHCLSAAGSIESIAAVLQLHQGFSNINCEDLNPEITSIIDVSNSAKLIETELNIAKPVLEMLTVASSQKNITV
jgi:3-oxoacyl-(acyl-carrier-protein) synthase